MIGLWKNKAGYVSHKNGLTEEQLKFLKDLKVGDRLVLFVNEVREGEKSPNATLKRSTLVKAVANA